MGSALVSTLLTRSLICISSMMSDLRRTSHGLIHSITLYYAGIYLVEESGHLVGVVTFVPLFPIVTTLLCQEIGRSLWLYSALGLLQGL